MKTRINNFIFKSIMIFFVIGIPVGILNAFRTVEYTVMVSGKERQCDTRDSPCYYVVYGRDGEVFTNTDSLLYLKWNSASVQARILEGHRFKIRAAGYRIPFFSMKPNIISVEEATDDSSSVST